MPILSWFKGNQPSMHYIHMIHIIANNMNASMELVNPSWKKRYLCLASHITNMSSNNIGLVIYYIL